MATEPTTKLASTRVNVLLSAFPGLSLPSTTCIPLQSTTTTEELLDHISSLLPPNLLTSSRLILTTTANKQILRSQSTTLAELVQRDDPSSTASTTSLPVRLSVPLCGGKGGFGSQLRAAGGRMSSRKRKQNAELATGSARNLDGRRLRTVTEAKNLAAYLATKPDMDRKEKEERRKRWEQVVELAEKREADMRSGTGADGRRKGLSEEWMDSKEEVTDNVKSAVRLAMMAQEDHQATSRAEQSSGSGGSEPASANDSEDEQDIMDLEDEEVGRLKMEAEAGDTDALWVLKNKLKIPPHLLPSVKPQQRRYVGFDDDDETSSSNDSDEQGTMNRKGKDKVKVAPD